jgi:hypothetical protein
MDLPRRFAYGPQWQLIVVMFTSGAAILFWVGKVSIGFGIALSFLPLSFALMGTVRRFFLPRFLELGQDTLLISAGFLQTRVAKIPYVDIEQTSEVRRGSMKTIYLRTKEHAFEITSALLPSMASYVAVRDFINSRVTKNERTQPPVEAGKYCFRCSYEGNGEIYNSNGGILWRFKTLHKRPHYPYGLFRLPDFVVYDKADKELFRIKSKCKWALAQFMMLENGLPICTINQRSILRNKFTLNFTNGQEWVFQMPLFTVNFGGWSEAGEKIRVRFRSHNIWYVLIDTKADTPQLVAALALIHRERLRFN